MEPAGVRQENSLYLFPHVDRKVQSARMNYKGEENERAIYESLMSFRKQHYQYHTLWIFLLSVYKSALHIIYGY